jgi:hypothetical protein
VYALIRGILALILLSHELALATGRNLLSPFLGLHCFPFFRAIKRVFLACPTSSRFTLFVSS